MAALWVVLYHWGASVDRSTLQGVWGALFNGPSAVIVFFVISGFCIHFPYRKLDQEVHIVPFLLRRYGRVGIPLLLARIWSPTFHVTTAALIDAVGWSLIVELIFYSIYPFLRFPRNHGAWIEYLVCFFVLGFAVVAWRGFPADYAKWGHLFNWMLAFPCWLLGCFLASQYDSLPCKSGSRGHLWWWRLSMILAGALCGVLRYHSPIGYPWTLNALAVLIFFWIRQEIMSAGQKATAFGRVLAWGGTWSYSMYLVHGMGIHYVSKWVIPGVPMGVNYVVQGCGVLAFCYLFYLVVEKPSHWISRWIAGRLDSLYERTRRYEYVE